MKRVFWLCCLLCLPTVASAENNPRPDTRLNVLFFMADDMRPDLGCYGHTIVKSPNLDKLAAAGIRFDRAYCQYPLCNPSRSSLLTGRLPVTTGVLDNTASVRQLHPDWVTLPEHFKRNGYVSLRSGKIFHGGIDDPISWDEGGEQPAKTPPAKPDPKTRQTRSDRVIVLEGDGASHADNGIADRAIAYMNKYKDKSFFLACGFQKPHSPPTAPKRFFDLYDADRIPLPANFAPRPTLPDGFPRASLNKNNSDLFIERDASDAEARKVIQAYWASISYVDWNIGRVLTELDRLGLREKTIVLFWGDHGYHLGEMGKWSKHGSLFEVGTRVPFIVSAPGAKANGKATSSPVQAIDFYPTLCELCDLKSPTGLEGHSLKSLLQDPAAAWDHPAISIGGNVKNLGVAVRTDRYRYAEWNGGKNGAMLFDEIKDPLEHKNLVDDPAYSAVRQKLQAIAGKTRELQK